MYYIGIDLGTSSLKLLLVNSDGTILNSVTSDYPLYFPKPGWSEQNPEDWWSAVCDGVPRLIKDFDAGLIAGIAVAGQMHGLVTLDNEDKIIRPAILWNDSRTEAEVEYLNNVIGKQFLVRHTANIAFAGFTAPKILWMYNNEMKNFGRICKIMLPKDYINYKLTGVHSCDYSDASGTLLLDVENKCWSEEMLQLCRISKAQLPTLFESYEIVGTILPEAAKTLGLPPTVKVCAGAGDNAAAAIGTGVAGKGACNISLGTSGTIFMSSDTFKVDPNNALHAFAHADGAWHLMACMLSAASCNKWFAENILRLESPNEVQAEIADKRLGRNEVFFLPYLMGERSPINDTDARGVFIGLNLDSSRADMLQAVFEGVAFAIRDSFEIVKALGVGISSSMVCGGGSKSELWVKIIANVLNIPLNIPATEQGPGYGAAILSMVACGEYASVEKAPRKLFEIKKTILPDPDIVQLYEHKYSKFKKIYPCCRELFKQLR